MTEETIDTTSVPKKLEETNEQQKEKETETEKETEKDTAQEEVSEEPQAYFEPVVKLDEIEVVSGEENEEVIFKMRAKLFNFRETLLDQGTGNKTWCERGIGDVRFLKHKETGKVRMLMRQEKTHKIIINHLVESRTELSPNMGSDRAHVFSCYDFSDGVLESQVFALRFANSENAQKFKEAHDVAKETNKVFEAAEAAADEAEVNATKAMEKLSVETKKESVEKE